MKQLRRPHNRTTDREAGYFAMRRAPILSLVFTLMLIVSGCERTIPSSRTTAPSQSPSAGQPGDGSAPTSAGIAVEPAVGSPGAEIKVSGTGWKPNEMVNIILADQSGRSDVLAAKAADANGSFETSFLYPSFDRWSAPGQYFVLAYTANYATEVTALIEVNAGDQAGEPPTATSVAISRGGAVATATPTVEHAATTARGEPSGPTATILPDSGTAFTEVTVSGGGFPANARVSVYLAGLVQTRAGASSQPFAYASTFTSDEGVYRMIFPMPKNWPDGRPLETGQITILVATDDFGTRASAIFNFTAPTPTPTSTYTHTPTHTPTATFTHTPTPRVRPAVQISPSSGTAGTVVSVSCTGYPAHTRLGVYLAGLVQTRGAATQQPYEYASTVTDGNGRCQPFSFAMPALWPDGRPLESGEITVLLATDNFAVRASAVFSYTAPTPTPVSAPYAEVSPASGTAGTELTITGGGFPAGTRINLHLGKFDGQIGSGNIVIYGTGVTDSLGNFTLRFTLPNAWPDGTPIEEGKILILVGTEGLDIQASAVFDYLIKAPTATATATATPTPAPISGWDASYWNNPRLVGPPALNRIDPEIDFDWGFGSPDPAVLRNEFSARWTRQINVESGVYVFSLTMDDGARLFVDGQLILDDWRLGSERTRTVDAWLSAGQHEVRVEFFELTERAMIRFGYHRAGQQGWRGEYFDNPWLNGQPVLVRTDGAIDFAWGTGSPGRGVPVDRFSARWTQEANFAADIYRFTAVVDDGIRVWIDQTLILDEWHDSRENVYSVDVNIPAGSHFVRVEYYENTLGASIRFGWERRSVSDASVPTPTSTSLPTATPQPVSTSTPTTVPDTDNFVKAITVAVSGGRDDAEEEGDGGVNHDSDELEMTDHSSGQQMIGLRFQNVNVPQGAIILFAYVDFTTEAVSSRATTLIFRGEATDDAAPFARDRFNISQRASTAASVTWPNVPGWTAVGQVHRSPDLAGIIQEIVNRNGWRSGNALALIISGDGQRIAESYDGFPEAAPRLYIEYR